MAGVRQIDWAAVEEEALKQKMLIDGNLIYWEKFGHGAQVVLFVAGVLGDIASCFHPVWEKMDVEKFTLVGLDLPGFGQSRPPNIDFRDEEIQQKNAKVAIELMKRLEFQRFSVVTHSGGGHVATLLANWLPEAVEKLIYCNAPIRADVQLVKAIRAMNDLDVWGEKQKNYFLKTYGKTYTEFVLQSWLCLVEREVDTQKVGALYVKQLTKVKVPALAIFGTKDIIVSTDTPFEMKLYIPHLRIHTVQNGQHSHLTFLDEFVRISQEFLSE